MPGYEAVITIARPVGEVFKYLSDVVAWPHWMPVQSVNLLDPGAPRVGMRASGSMAEGSRHAPFSIEITELEPDKRIAFRTLSGPMNWNGSWEVRAVDARTTEVRSVGSMRLRGVRRILEPFMAGEVQRNEQTELVNLRQVLEAAAP